MDDWAFPLRRDFRADELRDICRELCRLRKERGWTQEELARRSGVEPCTISEYERGASCPRSMSAVIMIARALDRTFTLSEDESSFWTMAPEEWRIVEVIEKGPFRTVMYRRVRASEAP